MNNPYVHYYTNQQNGHGMAVFKGSQWQRGYGQTGYGLGGLFRVLGRFAKPIFKTTLKGASRIAGYVGKPVFKGATQAARDIAINTAVDSLGDVLAGKKPQEILKHRGLQALNAAKGKAVKRLQTYAQTGHGKRKRTRSNTSTKKKRVSISKTTKKRRVSKSRTVKKRKTSASTRRRRQTKKQKTAVDIFG